MLVFEIVLQNNLLTLVDILNMYCLKKNYIKNYNFCLESGLLYNIDNKKLKNIIYKNKFLEKLDIYFCTNFTFKTFRILSKQLKNLLYLTICNSHIFDSGLHIIANNCKKLKYISLNNCKFITDNGIKVLVRDCRTITTLSLDYCNITNNSLKYISRYLHGIINLSICFCYLITDIGLIYLANRCKNIETLYLIDTYITDFGMYNIIMNCKYINSIDLIHCNLITDDTIERFYNLQYICDINLGNVIYITDYSVQLLFNKCINLKNFTIINNNRITDKSFKLLNNKSCNLEKLNLSYCNNITDKSLKIICKYWYTLKELNLKSTNITDVSAKYIADNCIFIEIINFQNTKITNIAIKNIALFCDLLKKFNLSKCKNISYDGIRYIFYYCKNLMYLSIPKYNQIRSNHFNNEICKYLEYIYIDNMDPVKLNKIK